MKRGVSTIKLLKLGKKKIAIIIICIIAIIAIIALVSLYISKREIRDWVDINIFRKNITDQDIQTILLSADKNNQIYVYGKNIVILKDKNIKLYNSFGEELSSMNININTALFDSSSKYLAIAENGGKELCLMLEKSYLWSVTTDSEILQVHVNKNGYVAVVTTSSTHKSILTLYSPEGNSIFTSYFATTRIIDASISSDNKYVAIGEIDTSGTTIQSNIKILSVEKAKSDAKETIIKKHMSENGKIITNVEYQDNNQIICMYEDIIERINTNNDETQKINIDTNKISYLSIELNNNYAYIEEEKEGIFEISSNIHIINTLNNQEITYKIDDIAKQMYTNENIIAVNVGTDIYFIDSKGWLIKKYTSNQEITKVKLSQELAVIIYKDKIEIIDF